MMKIAVCLSVCLLLSGLSGVEIRNFYGKELKEPSSGKRIVLSRDPQKKLKVFFIMPAKVSAGAMEWKARFELEPVILQTDSYQSFSPWHSKKAKTYALGIEKEEYEQILRERLSQLKECDAAVLCKTEWNILPPEVRNAIRERVYSGAGLLYITHEGKTVPRKELGIEGAYRPDFPMAGKLADTKAYRGRLGKGKVIALDYGTIAKTVQWYLIEPVAPFQSDDPLYYDLYYLFATRCLLDLTSDGKADLAAESPPEIYNRYGERTDSTMPGENLLLFRKLDQSGKLADFSVKIHKETAKKGFGKVSLAKECVKPGETIRVDSEFETPFSGIFTAELKTPENGRIIFRMRRNLNNARNFSFDLPIPDAEAEAGELSVRLNGNLKDERRADLYFDNPQTIRDFDLIVWANIIPGSRLSFSMFQELKRCGTGIVMDTEIQWYKADQIPAVPRLLKKTGLKPAYYATRLLGPKKPPKQNCVLSRWRQWKQNGKPVQKRIQAIARAGKGMGSVFYNLGDENGLFVHKEVDTCHCPECRAAFQVYLKRIYGTLEKMNAEYGTSFKNWDEVKSLTLEEACDRELLPMWVDHRLFMEEQFIGYHRWAIAQVHAQDPGARCGIEGLCFPHNSFSGFRLYDMLPYFRFFAPYPSDREIHAMKYLPEDAVKAAWFGTYEGAMNESRMRSTPWSHLFKGLNRTAWWTAGVASSQGGFSNTAALAPDGTPLQPFAWAAEEIRKIRESGIGALIVNAKKKRFPIAVHYSNPCLHASTLNPDQSTWQASHENISLALTSCGLDYDFLSPKELENGKLHDYRILLLPYSQALSEAECRQIRSFVENGGLLIADFNPGIMDEHGKRLPKSRLQDVFGNFSRLHVNAYGKGHAICLTDYLAGFKAKLQKGTADGLMRGMMRLFREYAALEPFAVVVNEKECLEAHFDFEADGFQYLCMLGSTETGKKLVGGAESSSETFGASASPVRKIRLPKKYHVWDPLDNYRYLGFADSATLDLKPFTGRVLVLSERKPPALQSALEKSEILRGETLRLQVANPAPVMLMDIPGLRGPRRVFGGEIHVRTAYNDPPGDYRLTLRHPVTGQSETISFELK